MMVVRYGSYEFSPGGWASVSTVLGLAIFIFLGQWQLERAAHKQALVEEYANRARRPRLEIAGTPTTSLDIPSRRADIQGQDR